MASPNDLRARARAISSLTDQLGVRLEVLTDARPAVGAQVKLAGLGSDGNADIATLAFLVLMEAAESAREDLRAIMDAVKELNKAKQGWRSAADELNRQASGTGADDDCPECLDFDSICQLMLVLWAREIEGETDDVLDALSDVSEEDQLRMQMLLQRRARAMTLISNIMKKLSESQNQLVQNIK